MIRRPTLPKINMSVKWSLISSFIVIIIITSILLYVAQMLNLQRLDSTLENSFIELTKEKIDHDLDVATNIFKSYIDSTKLFVLEAAHESHILSAYANKNEKALTNALERAMNHSKLDFLTFIGLDGVVIARGTWQHVGDNLSSHPIVRACLQGEKSGSIIVQSENDLRKEGLTEKAKIEIVSSSDGRSLDKTTETSALTIQTGVVIYDAEANPIGIIIGGILLNNNVYIVDGIYDLLYEGHIEIDGFTIFLDDVRISSSSLSKNGDRSVGLQTTKSIYEQVIIKGESQILQETLLGKEYIVAYQPIRDYRNKIVGMLALCMAKRKHFESRMAERSHQIYFLCGFLAAMLVGVGCAHLLARYMSLPIKALVARTEKLAQGDLYTKVTVCSENELGRLGQTIQTTIVNLNDLVGQVQQANQKINQAAEGISHSVQRQASSSTEQSTAVTETTSTMEELVVSSSQIADSTDFVASVAEKTQEDAQHGVAAMDEMIQHMEEIQNMNDRSIREITELGKKTKRIWAIMDIINDVAGRTKLIAFNAALEAAAAGETGKRFRVVATEIRRLADNVTESTDEIRGKISEIQKAMDQLVAVSVDKSRKIYQGTETASGTASSLQSIMKGVDQTTSSAKQISLATQQQRTASEQVVQSLREISSAITTTVQSIRQTNVTVEDLRNLSEQLATTTARFKIDES